jgi:hypothetical protein
MQIIGNISFLKPDDGQRIISDMLYQKKGSQDSVVSIATGYGLDDQGVGVQVPVGSRIFSSPHHPD